MWLEDNGDEEEEELPAYLLSALTETQVLKMEVICPRTSFQKQKPKQPLHKFPSVTVIRSPLPLSPSL